MKTTKLTNFFPATVEENEAIEILQKNYAIEVESLKRLSGFDTINYCVKTSTPILNHNQNYLLKIAPCTDPPYAAEIFHEQINLMQNLYEEIPSLIQKVLPTKDGKHVITTKLICKNSKINDEHVHYVALFEFIEGRAMDTVVPFSLALVKDLGRKYGQLSLALQKCPNVTTSREDFHWDPRNVIRCEESFELLTKTGQDGRRRICESFLNRFKKEKLSKIEATCREALINSDGTCKNIIVHPENPDCVRAVLDFEDACHSYLIFECGTLLGSVLTFIPEEEAGEIGRALMKGFTEVCPLLESEWDLLLDATLCRTLQHQIACLVASVEHPENSSYLLATYDVEWSIFDRLISEDGPELLKFWRS